MTLIFIIGGREDTAEESLIKNTLSGTYRTVYVKGETLDVRGVGYELVFLDCERPVICGAENAVVIAKKNAVLPDKLPENCTVIFDADDRSQIDTVCRNGVFAVDCGFSHTSTVSFSSESESTIVVSLNRSIRALSGREIQPLEIPVPKHGADDYSLMSFTALRLLLDDFDSELGELM